MKKSRRVLLALACLLATVLLTVGCTATGSQIPEETPAPDSAPDTSTAPATEPQQTETEATTKTALSSETEPPAEAAVNNEPPVPVVPLYDTEKTSFYSNNYFVLVGNSIYYTNPDGIYRMYEGQETLLYRGSFTHHWVCTDGKLLYTVDAAGDVLQLDLVAGNIRTLFNAGPFAYVVGASDEVLYLGLQENEEDWWGYDPCVYSFDGTLLERLGEDLDVHMVDGILCCSERNPVGDIVSFQVYDRNGSQIVDTEEIGNYSVLNGAVYYVVSEESYSVEKNSYLYDYTSSLFRVDGSGTTVLATFEDAPFGNGYSDGLLIFEGKIYSLENGAELPRDLVDTLCGRDSFNNIYGKDCNGKWYSFDLWNGIALRENDEGEFVQCSACPENMNFIGLCGDWAYVFDFDEAWETITITGTYVPVP